MLPIAFDNTLSLAPDHPALAAREVREAIGQDGRDCGFKNAALFFEGHRGSSKELRAHAADAALRFPAFVESHAAGSVLYGKRKRGSSEARRVTASAVADYHRSPTGMATNLTMALLAAALDTDLYVISPYGGGGYKATLYAGNARLAGRNSNVGKGLVAGDAEALERLMDYKGPVLKFRSGHWSAFPLRGALLPRGSTPGRRTRGGGF